MRRVYVGAYDPPVVPDDSNEIRDIHVVAQTPSYGRVLFRDNPAIVIAAHYRNIHVRVEDCVIEAAGGVGLHIEA